jgi:hypothetical protein
MAKAITGHPFVDMETAQQASYLSGAEAQGSNFLGTFQSVDFFLFFFVSRFFFHAFFPFFFVFVWFILFLFVSFHFTDARVPVFYKIHAPLLGAASPPTNTPSAPRDLTAILISSRFVTLTWLAPLVTNGGAVLTYSVYYKQVGSTRERVFNTSATQKEANIQGLRPDSNYAFRVVAYNDHGPGDSTKELNVQTHPEGNGCSD